MQELEINRFKRNNKRGKLHLKRQVRRVRQVAKKTQKTRRKKEL
jgi:hypothetical protein